MLNHVSRFMPYALRHNPSEFGLEIDGEGYVRTDELLAAQKAKEEEE